ncbi:hypothetical protein [Megasphaera massiliensis]|uniref:hypothetical protein n=2 Tax=Megasphaera massiliensis TaxID=1232428 RepID=UPI00258ED743|nr:hypothetical protein [uncultured Megasphaera sp.]MBS6256494.1 hypothetical protein [Megasphaera sp.]
MRNLILSHHFSASCRNFLAQAGIQAYQYGAELLETTSLGMSERGRSLHPHLVNVLYDYNIKSLCDAGEIPFSVEECMNKARNSYYYLFRGDGIEFTVSKVSKKNSFPRDAIFRKNYAQNNDMISLFPELEMTDIDGIAYAILTHGGNGNKMSFARMGFPRKDTKSWIGNQVYLFDRTQNLVLIPKSESAVIEIARPKLKNIENILGEKIK